MEFYEKFSSVELIFFWMGLIGSIGIGVQLLFGGLDDFDTDSDSDTSGDGGFDLFTIKNLIIFIAILGWAGLVGMEHEWGIGMSVFFGVSLALSVVTLVTGLFWWFSKMNHDGTLKMENCVGALGYAHTTIPANGLGKVHITVQDALKEFDAISHLKEPIPTGFMIKVVSVNGDILEVKAA